MGVVTKKPTAIGWNALPSAGLAIRSRGPSTSWWKTRTCARKAPTASVTTGAVRWVMPIDQVRTTGVFGGKPLPVAIVTIPGGPRGGSTFSSALEPAPVSRTVCGEPTPLSVTRSVDARGPNVLRTERDGDRA